MKPSKRNREREAREAERRQGKQPVMSKYERKLKAEAQRLREEHRQ